MTTVPAGTEHEYAHEFHAGNVGDVLKHVVLAAVLEEARKAGPVAYVDTHSGEGHYTLRTTGEWAEGVFQIWREAPPAGPGVHAWLDVVRSLGTRADRPERYPGSPLLATRLAAAGSTFDLFETHPAAAAALRRNLGAIPGVTIHERDGFAGLAAAIDRLQGRRLVALVDPPYVTREDWTATVDAIVDAHRRSPDAVLLAWYPVKSWSRPHVLVRAVRDAGVPATVFDLVTTPLEHKRNRLNGSGILGVNLPPPLVDALCGLLPTLGRRCATRNGEWSLHVNAWRKPIA